MKEKNIILIILMHDIVNTRRHMFAFQKVKSMEVK